MDYLEKQSWRLNFECNVKLFYSVACAPYPSSQSKQNVTTRIKSLIDKNLSLYQWALLHVYTLTLLITCPILMRFPLKFSREVSFASFLLFITACPSESIAVTSSITLFKYLKRRNDFNNQKRKRRIFLYVIHMLWM